VPTQRQKQRPVAKKKHRNPLPKIEPNSGEYLDWIGAAAYLGVTVRWLKRRVERREIAFHRFGRLIRFHVADLDAYIAEHRIEAEGRMR
jgi:excisionase family DNA binding protein